LSCKNELFELLDPENGSNVAHDKFFASAGNSLDMNLDHLGLDAVQADLLSKKITSMKIVMKKIVLLHMVMIIFSKFVCYTNLHYIFKAWM
jgi:hypothetical protein